MNKALLLPAAASAALGVVFTASTIFTSPQKSEATRIEAPAPVVVVDEAEDQRRRKIEQEKADRELQQGLTSPTESQAKLAAIAGMTIEDRQSLCSNPSHTYYSSYKEACAQYYAQF
jgi:hypothetical protein